MVASCNALVGCYVKVKELCVPLGRLLLCVASLQDSGKFSELQTAVTLWFLVRFGQSTPHFSSFALQNAEM